MRNRFEEGGGYHDKEEEVRNRFEEGGGHHDNEEEVRNRFEEDRGYHDKEEEARNRFEGGGGHHDNEEEVRGMGNGHRQQTKILGMYTVLPGRGALTSRPFFLGCFLLLCLN